MLVSKEDKMSVFSVFWSKVKEVLQKMIGAKTVESVLQIKPAVSDDMANAIQLWGAMYEEKAPWLHNPDSDNPIAIKSLGLASLIASEKARTALLEFESEITTPTEEVESPNPDYKPFTTDMFGNEIPSQDSETITTEEPVSDTSRAEYLNKQYEKLKKQLRSQIEYGIAKGGIVLKPYVVKSDVTEEEENEKTEEGTDTTVSMVTEPYTIEFDWVQADGFFPLAFDGGGRMTEAAFVQRKIDKDTTYSRLEYHKYENGKVTVKNKAFKTAKSAASGGIEDDNLGKEIPLTDVPEWAEIAPEAVIKDVDRLMFAYFKMPEANTIDTYSNLGVSGYSRAVTLIRDADIQYSRLLWEYEAGEMAINVDRDAFNYMVEDSVTNKGHSNLPVMQQRLYRQLDVSGEELFQPYSPTLRDTSYMQGLNTILMRIEDVTGLSRGTISDGSQEARTATEIKLLKQRSFQTNQDIQIAIQNMLEDAIYIMNAYCDLYKITAPGQIDTSFEWDDSILVDVEAELGKRITLMQNGLTSKLETRMWYFGETEVQAREALAQIDSESQAAMEQNLVNQMEMQNISNQGNEEENKANA